MGRAFVPVAATLERKDQPMGRERSFGGLGVTSKKGCDDVRVGDKNQDKTDEGGRRGADVSETRDALTSCERALRAWI